MWQRGVVKEAELLQRYVLTHTVSHICLGNASHVCLLLCYTCTEAVSTYVWKACNSES